MNVFATGCRYIVNCGISYENAVHFHIPAICKV
jgi:hypothetical protein